MWISNFFCKIWYNKYTMQNISNNNITLEKLTNKVNEIINYINSLNTKEVKVVSRAKNKVKK